MNRSPWLLAIAFILPAAAEATDIYKCSGGRFVAYQNYPCPPGLDQQVMIDQPRPAVAPVPEQRPAQSSNQSLQVQSPQVAMLPTPLPQAQDSGGPLPFRRTTLRLGMSDDQVLNLPRWGVPARITRSKVNGLWNEDWVYESRDGSLRHLHFQNAVLTLIDSDYVPPTQIATAPMQ